ncbi:MOSC domain-containing protein [Melghirimyces algeriensis]|nr:MOSC domain-containing protein [Melghirimyces algeriensis]
MMKPIGSVKKLWSYPVKSLLGQTQSEVMIEPRGVVGDRRYAIRDVNGKLGSGKTTKRFQRIAGLFELQAHVDGDQPVITFPDGESIREGDPNMDLRLSDFLGQKVTLVKEQDRSHFDEAPIHMITTAAMKWLKTELPSSVIDERRFRPNIVIQTNGDQPVEHYWVGQRVHLGEVVLEVIGLTKRCVMTTMQQPQLPRDPAVLKQISQGADANLGVYAKVLKPGKLCTGDHVEIAERF